MKYIISFSFLLVFCFSCKEEDPVAFTTIFGITDFDEARKVIKNYAYFGVYTEGLAKLDLQNEIRDEEDILIGRISSYFRESIDQPRSDGGIYTIDDVTLEFEGEGYGPTGYKNFSPECGNKVKELMGKQINFRLNRNGQDIYNHVMYVPQEIEFSLESEEPETIYKPYKISRNSAINWNTDDQNGNGVLLVVRWDGFTTDVSLEEINNFSGNHYFKAAWFEDSGFANIPSELFEDLPESASFTLFIARADYALLEGKDGLKYRVAGMSEDRKRVVLID